MEAAASEAARPPRPCVRCVTVSLERASDFASLSRFDIDTGSLNTRRTLLHLSSCEVGVRLHVEVPAQSFELSLAEVHSLRANLPREDKRSLVALLRACYARLHGVDPATCSQPFPKTHQISWKNFKRSVDDVLDGKSAAAAAQRTQVVLVFDFVAGAFTKRMATAAAATSGEQQVHLAVRLKRRMYDEPKDKLTLDRHEAVAVARVRPRRESSASAAEARVRAELELDEAWVNAEADEAERWRSWELAEAEEEGGEEEGDGEEGDEEEGGDEEGGAEAATEAAEAETTEAAVADAAEKEVAGALLLLLGKPSLARPRASGRAKLAKQV